MGIKYYFFKKCFYFPIIYYLVKPTSWCEQSDGAIFFKETGLEDMPLCMFLHITSFTLMFFLTDIAEQEQT